MIIRINWVVALCGVFVLFLAIYLKSIYLVIYVVAVYSYLSFRIYPDDITFEFKMDYFKKPKGDTRGERLKNFLINRMNTEKDTSGIFYKDGSEQPVINLFLPSIRDSAEYHANFFSSKKYELNQKDKEKIVVALISDVIEHEYLHHTLREIADFKSDNQHFIINKIKSDRIGDTVHRLILIKMALEFNVEEGDNEFKKIAERLDL